MSSIILALQFQPGDLVAAQDLLQLLCDLEPEPAVDQQLWLMHRKDCPLGTVLAMRDLARLKFPKAEMHRARNHGTGWPYGANMLWLSTMVEAQRQAMDGKVKETGVFTFEPDCCPLRQDWRQCIADEWDSAKALFNAKVMGSRVDSNGRDDHINGNAVFDCRIMEEFPVLQGQPQNVAWDYHHRQLFVSIAYDTPVIIQRYSWPTMTIDQLANMTDEMPDAALLHGVKDSSARRNMRRLLLNPESKKMRTEAPPFQEPVVPVQWTEPVQLKAPLKKKKVVAKKEFPPLDIQRAE